MPLPAAAERVQKALAAAGSPAQVREFPAGTRTVAEAAAAIGVEKGQIAKSLVFMAGEVPVLVVMSGRDRVDVAKLASCVGAPVRQVTADEVKSTTGYAIGGVPPVGHSNGLRIFLDEHLWEYETVYAAAGTPMTAFATSAAELLALSGGERANLFEVGRS